MNIIIKLTLWLDVNAAYEGRHSVRARVIVQQQVTGSGKHGRAVLVVVMVLVVIGLPGKKHIGVHLHTEKICLVITL